VKTIFLIIITTLNSGEEITTINYMPSMLVCEQAQSALVKVEKIKTTCTTQTVERNIGAHPWSLK
tara:strand:- start:1340 stop:1534 length:195 start_codon:yes stop_codon:yes gene_type:complete